MHIGNLLGQWKRAPRRSHDSRGESIGSGRRKRPPRVVAEAFPLFTSFP